MGTSRRSESTAGLRFQPGLANAEAMESRNLPQNEIVAYLGVPNRGSYTVGLMFWLWRNRFVGSYLFFTATSRS